MALASADFNRDGFADLAVGSPGEAVGSVWSAGSVVVIYGSRSGLNTSRTARFDQPGGALQGAYWGASLAAADLNADGYPDLAVGAPQMNCDVYCYSSGSVGILSGGAHGITSSGVVTISGVVADEDGLGGDVLFGADLDVADLDGDGDADLVVVSKGIGLLEWQQTGSVSACLGQPGGPHECTQLLHGPCMDVTTLAVGNMSGGALPEIVVGCPEYDDFGGRGFVVILHLTSTPAVAALDTTILGQDDPGVPDTAEAEDMFGYRVDLGDIDRDGYADLVVGVPGENEGGIVSVIHGAVDGWRTSGNYSYSQNTRGIPGTAEYLDWFGSSLALLDHDRDGRLDLSIGADGENQNSGAITTLRGSGTRFTTKGSRTFTLATLGYRYPARAAFGTSLARSPSLCMLSLDYC